MRRRAASIPALLLAAAIARPAPAQTIEENAQFGLALSKRGYADLARELLDKLRDAASTDGEKRAYAMALLQVASENIDRAPAEERARCIEQAIDVHKQFLATGGHAPEADQARFAIGELLSRKGRLLEDLARRDGKPERILDAEKSFRDAARFYKDIADQCARDEAELRRRDSRPPGLPEPEKKRLDRIVEHRMLARHHGGVALFDHAVAMDGRAAGAGGDLHQQVIRHFKEFLWDYKGFVVAFDAALYLGRSYAALDDIGQAIPCFDQAWSILDVEGGKQYAEIAQRAYYHKCQALVGKAERTRDATLYEETLRVLDALFRKFPALQAEDLGKSCLIEKANALVGLGKQDEAMRIYKSFIAEGGRWDYLVKRRIGQILGGGVPLALRVAAVDSLIVEKRFAEAIRQYRHLIRDASSAPDRAEQVPTCYYKIGMCYLYQGRYEEAMIAFEALERNPGHPLAEEAAYERVRAANQERRFIEALFPGDAKVVEEQVRLAMDRFIALFPASPRAWDLIYSRAAAEEGRHNYKEAAALYAKVPSSAPLYENSLAAIGHCGYKQAEAIWDKYKKERAARVAQLREDRKRARLPDLAEAELEKMADVALGTWIKEATRLFNEAEARLKEYNACGADRLKTDPQCPGSRKAAVLVARNALSKLYLHEALHKPQAVLDLLRDVEVDFNDTEFDAQVSQILESRLKAAIELDLLKGDGPMTALSTLDLLRRRYPVAGARIITRCAKEIAWAFDKQAAALDVEIQSMKAPNPDALTAAVPEGQDLAARLQQKRDEALRFRRLSAALFHDWIVRRADEGPAVRPAELEGAGALLVDLADGTSSPDERRQFYEMALDVYRLLWKQIDDYQTGKSKDPPQGIHPDDCWKTAWRMAKCNAAIGKHEDAIRAYDGILRDERLKGMGFLFEEKAAVHDRYGDALWDRERQKATEQYHCAQRIYSALSQRVDPLATPPPPKEALRAYWNSHLASIRLLVKLNDLENARRSIRNQKQWNPKLDQNEFGYQSAVEAIDTWLDQKLPPSRNP
jgi:tetratricopeptide (TPR) repeat protein